MTTAQYALETFDALAKQAQSHRESFHGGEHDARCSRCDDWREVVRRAGELYEAERNAEDRAEAFRRAIGCR